MLRKKKSAKPTFAVMIVLLLLSHVPSLVFPAYASGPESGRKLDFHGDTSTYATMFDATPTGNSYMLYEHHGGNWSDAEKRPPDDGEGNPPPVNPGEEDDLMCWAATASNVLEWTGWGFVSGMANSDQMFQHFQDHWTDQGGFMEWAWRWWFDGVDLSGGQVDVLGGGNFWPSYDFSDYYHEEWTTSNAMGAIDDYLHNGYGMGMAIYNPPTGAHAITVWGYNYNPADPTDYYGIWVTDSDDSKTSTAAPNLLRYYEVSYNAGQGRWYLQDYYGSNGWHIGGVEALEAAPTLVRVLELERVTSWYWTQNTYGRSMFVGDVDGDADDEIVTSGRYYDGTRYIAQLCVWSGSALAPEHVRVWYWTSNTTINSVTVADVDTDGSAEIVTGGYYYDGTRNVAQLCVWSGSTLAVENVKAWYWTSDTAIQSVTVGDVDTDKSVEIITSGYYYDGTRAVAQLCVWSGSTLGLKDVRAWYWIGDTTIYSVAVGDVDSDGSTEIVTGGCYYDGVRDNSQLCVWSGSTLSLERVKTWYWTSHTYIYSVVVGDVDADGSFEIVTGGGHFDGTRYNAQLCVWSGSALALENVEVWYWISDTGIVPVVVGDVDDDGFTEIVTGAGYFDGMCWIAQLVVWSGSTLALKSVKAWYWTSDTYIYSVAVGNVDDDILTEIIVFGDYNDGTRSCAQLSVWYFAAVL